MSTLSDAAGLIASYSLRAKILVFTGIAVAGLALALAPPSIFAIYPLRTRLVVVAGVCLVFAALIFGLGENAAAEADQQKLTDQHLLPTEYAFSEICSEISETVSKLELDDGLLVERYVSETDGHRLFDGLYSSLLYASHAAVTGIVDARFYGNLMEWSSATRQIRVRYFSGPYNDEIITRSFPADGKKSGVAGEVFSKREVKIKNRMGNESKERGEVRLNAMVCFPIPFLEPVEGTRQIVILNIDAALHDVFPEPGDNWRSSGMKTRVDQLAGLIARANRLYRTHIERNSSGHICRNCRAPEEGDTAEKS